MKDYIQYIKEFHNGNQVEIDFVQTKLSKHLQTNPENQDEIEQILDYLFANLIDISKVGYKVLLQKTEKWHKKLQQLSSKSDEIEGEDYNITLDFKDGFKFVQLKSQSSYNREGKLMSNCVASYYGRDCKIYSLRDEKNNPHCTIEEGQQVKGKGNGSIDPKYVEYVVKFLEKLGMTVGENEMKNLGYYKLSAIDEGLKCDKMYNGYIYENNLDRMVDKDGDIYSGFGILNIKNLIDFDLNMKFKINLNIQATVNYIIQKLSKKKDNKDSAQLASSGYSAQLASSGDSAQLASSGDSAKLASSGDYAQLASSGDYAKLDIQGEKSVGANIGYNGKIKGIIGTRIILAEYNNDHEVIYVKTAQIDGKKIKADTRYKLENKKFVETTI